MATTRIKDISKTTTDLASDTYGVFDGSTNGTQKMSRDDMYADWAAAYVAAPTTYKLAPLNSGTNKIDATYLPTSGDTPKGEWNASSNSPALADGSGVAGDYYDVTTAGTQNLGSGPIIFNVGDVVKYNGSTWFKIDSVANILDGSATAADGRSALSVNSKDEDAQANALKVTAPALYFNGTSSLITVADDDKLTFSSLTEFGKTTSGAWSPEDNTPALTDGTGTLNDHYKIDADGTVAQGGSTLSIIDGTSVTLGQVVYYDGSVWRVKDCDDLPFSVSCWVKRSSGGTFYVSKYFTTSQYEWRFQVNSGGDIQFLLTGLSGNAYTGTPSVNLDDFAGQWLHLCATYSGSSSSSGNYSTAADRIKLYVNGVDVTAGTVTNSGYDGIANTAAPVFLGAERSYRMDSEIRQTVIHNRELTASEVAQLARGNDLGFADEWGGSNGGVYTQDATPSGEWTAVNGTDSDVAGPINGRSNVLGLTVDNTLSNHYLRLPVTVGKRYRVTFDYNVSSGNDVIDSIRVYYGSYVAGTYTPTAGTWNRFSAEFVAGIDELRIYGATGTTTTIQDAGGDDIFYIDGLTLTEIGCLASFSAERYDTSTNKLYDISDNAFVGTGTSVTLTGREQPVYETGTWTPALEFSGGSTGITYGANTFGSYTRIGNVVHYNGYLTLTSKGSDTGFVYLSGLPFTVSSSADNNQSGLTVGIASSFSGLSGPISGLHLQSDTRILLYDWAATGTASLDDTNLTGTSEIRFSGTYQIQ